MWQKLDTYLYCIDPGALEHRVHETMSMICNETVYHIRHDKGTQKGYGISDGSLTTKLRYK